VVTEDEVERRGRERGRLGARRDQRERRPLLVLEATGVPELRDGLVEPDRPGAVAAQRDRPLRGTAPVLEDVTVAAKFKPEAAGFGLGVMTLDYDNDEPYPVEPE